MKRSRHLVAYDIRHPKRLRLVHRVLKGFGAPMQYSVFVCDLTSAECYDLLDQLTEIVDTRVDCVALVYLGDGGDSSRFMFMGPRPALPMSGPMVL
jgi:CRISPR-associated protein Cas2